VLKGACWATSKHLVDVRYRNFFVPERRDIFAGFRTVAL
jgi:iron(II)-dependent oxidoreductase